jgi:DNA replication protein DnaC
MGAFFYSDRKGNGKTSWACKILQEYFKQIIKNRAFSMKHCHGVFVNVPLLLRQLRDYENNSEGIAEMFEKLQNAELVIWDDIGAEIPTNWVREQLYILINHRDSYLRTNIYTSNVKLEELKKDENLGERIVDRINGHTEKFCSNSNSKRVK